MKWRNNDNPITVPEDCCPVSAPSSAHTYRWQERLQNCIHTETDWMNEWYLQNWNSPLNAIMTEEQASQIWNFVYFVLGRRRINSSGELTQDEMLCCSPLGWPYFCAGWSLLVSGDGPVQWHWWCHYLPGSGYEGAWDLEDPVSLKSKYRIIYIYIIS